MASGLDYVGRHAGSLTLVTMWGSAESRTEPLGLGDQGRCGVLYGRLWAAGSGPDGCAEGVEPLAASVVVGAPQVTIRDYGPTPGAGADDVWGVSWISARRLHSRGLSRLVRQKIWL